MVCGILMVFSDQAFIFLFLPFALAITLAAARTKAFHIALLCLSLLFFYWTSGFHTLLLLISIAVNYAGALMLSKQKSSALLCVVVAINVFLLVVFKYAGFAAGSLAPIFGVQPPEYLTGIALPIGISFYTFQGISYVVDVWRGDVRPERNPVTFGAYLSFFPQLIAGPIVRYHDVDQQFKKPILSTDMFAAGASRFTLGLAKKVLIADSVALVADAAFAHPGDLGMAAAWLGALAYAIQIYFDFSGYSDMAIGLGMMFGIRFLENFNHPYGAATVTDFWRRWHISLSSWFRDYVYIPLGGNRHSQRRTLFNLLTVFALTGLWHGAAWTFLFWGLWHGAFLLLERVIFGNREALPTSVMVRLAYFMPVILLGWVLFRAPDIEGFAAYATAMLNPLAGDLAGFPTEMLLAFSPQTFLAFAVGTSAILLQDRAAPLGPAIATIGARGTHQLVRLCFTTLALVLCAVTIIPQSFSPFLYFRF